MHVNDVPLLYQKHKEGIVDAPDSPAASVSRSQWALAVWMSFSSFLNTIDLKRIQEHYDRLFKTYL